jgi:DNA processing protein
MPGLPDAAYVAALMALPDMWPTRIGALLGLRRAKLGSLAPPPARSAAEAWERVRRGAALVDDRMRRRCGDHPDALARAWADAARRLDIARIWGRYVAAGVEVTLLGQPSYPTRLSEEGDAPYVLFTRGEMACVEHPTAAIVGTRSCTPTGREIAFEFGRALTVRGIAVVSGLALGVDGGAHAGALSAFDDSGPRDRSDGVAPPVGIVAGSLAPPVGIVAGSLDRPYPARHARLWQQVAAVGALASTAPLGTPHEAWRFPARNRILVSAADVVVVVESHARGGSMVTADVAVRRGKTVLAVPGSIRNPASQGTNRLLADGATPVCDVDDIVVAVSLATTRPWPVGAGASAARQTSSDSPRRASPEMSDAARAAFEALDATPVATEAIVARTRLSPSEATAALAELELGGLAEAGAGWWRRCD